MTGPEKPPRRPRYAGTHPRRFEDRYKERDPARFPGIHEHVRSRGDTPAGTHVPILVPEVLACLDLGPGQVVADGTLGFGGHAQAILRAIAPGGVLLGLDVDGEQLERTRERLDGPGARVVVARGNFAGLPAAMARAGLASLDALFVDLGVSSMQVDDPQRGFSYKTDGPLNMRMDRRRPRTAADVLATLDPRDLADVLRELSDEPDADAVAAAVARHRERAPIRTTRDLVRVVLDAKGLDPRAAKGAGGLHPAARTFQALRILVNDELAALERLLAVAPACLAPGGRFAVLTFHSGEDRRVKQAFREGLRDGTYADVAPDPIRAGPQEVRSNPRASPAKLRWAVRGGAP